MGQGWLSAGPDACFELARPRQMRPKNLRLASFRVDTGTATMAPLPTSIVLPER